MATLSVNNFSNIEANPTKPGDFFIKIIWQQFDMTNRKILIISPGWGRGESLSSEGLIIGRNFTFQNGLGLMLLFVLITFELILDGFF